MGTIGLKGNLSKTRSGRVRYRATFPGAGCNFPGRAWYVNQDILPAATWKITKVGQKEESERILSELSVSVLMERRLATVGQWTQPQWEAVGVIAGEDLNRSARRTQVHHDDSRDQYLWSGLKVELFKDGCESYWYNLQSDNPRLFVICYIEDEHDEDQLEVKPVFVTANQDEANAHMESDDPVYSVPMPDKVLQWVERFVLTHYEPEVKRKRKRKDWVEDSEYAKREREVLGRNRRH